MLEVFRKVAFRSVADRGTTPQWWTEKDVIGRLVGPKGSKQPAIWKNACEKYA